jgi:hypothetical protein
MTLPAATASLVAALNQRHNTLAARCVDGRPPAEDVQALISDIVAAGAVVPSGAERDALRNLLYFWASDQTSRGERPREASLPALAPFVESPAAEPQPAAVAASPQGPADSGSTASAPLATETAVKSVLPDAMGASTASGRAAAEIAGVVAQIVDRWRKIGGRDVELVPPETTSASAGTPTDAEARAIVRIAALARQWRQTDETNKKGYLLTGKALVEASLFVDRDPDIGALVAASEEQEEATERQKRFAQRVLQGLVAFAFCATLGLLFFVWVDEERKLRLTTQQSELKDFQIAALSESASQRGIRQRTQAAVEALSRDDLSPLKHLLENFGGANENDLRRLQLAPRTAPMERASDATFITPQRTGAPTPPVAPPTGATCSGYLWFGSKADSRLSDGRDPETLKMGDSATLDNRADIRLRADWPADGYVMTRQIGLVPAGSQVKLSSEPKAYHRGSGDQIWAQVTVPRTFCTTVFLQYSGTPDKRSAVLNALRDLGVQVPPAEMIAIAKGLAEVRYFWPDDEAVADQVAAALSSFNAGKKLGVVLVKNLTTKPSQGTVEVWLDFSR